MINLFRRLFTCRRIGHSPAPPVGGDGGYLSNHCARCGGALPGAR